VVTLQEDYILFEVQDTGVGISDENQTKLFKLFGFIEETSDQNTNGIGIGLMITD
jgi:signal transduction histidine kinase